jgi:hypothetical protein
MIYKQYLVKFWDLRKLYDFELVQRSDCIDTKTRKGPRYGEREQTVLAGSLCYYTHLMNIYKQMQNIKSSNNLVSYSLNLCYSYQAN